MENETQVYMEVYDSVENSMDNLYSGSGFWVKAKDIKRFLEICKYNKKFATIIFNYTEEWDNGR